jgi:hypothetical protein
VILTIVGEGSGDTTTYLTDSIATIVINIGVVKDLSSEKSQIGIYKDGLL